MKQNKAPNERKDHYVPRSYLKFFTDKNNPGFLNRYRKIKPNDCSLKSPAAVCYEKGGDYNPLFENNRPLDCYFKHIEDNYHKSVKSFEKGHYSAEAKFYIALNIARMRFWGPHRKELTKLYLNTDLGHRIDLIIKDLRENPERHKEAVEHFQKLFKDPDISAHSIADDLNDMNKPLINPDYSNSILMEGIAGSGLFYTLMPWSIIRNTTSQPFITSDNPICVIEMNENDPNTRQTHVYIPLTPMLAILIHVPPDSKTLLDLIISAIEVAQDGGEKLNSTLIHILSHLKTLLASTPSITPLGEIPQSGVEKLNSTVIKFANENIFSSVKDDWIKNLIEKNKTYKESYSEAVVEEGVENGRGYKIIKDRFGV